MSIGYYGKKQDDKFSYCSAVKPGETAIFLIVDYANSELSHLIYGYSEKVYQGIFLTSMIRIGVIPKVIKN
ncbi:hypothetical protein [Arthrospira sp. PCC 8006]|uniref:hypothetical protein n=1 Tax=Arthrospira sp. PCC 8006 TaxID=1982224 RepID=UPI00396F6CFF